MGFYGALFFRSWLVVAQNVEPTREKQPGFSLIMTAASAEEACELLRGYLMAEGFQFGPIAAFYG